MSLYNKFNEYLKDKFGERTLKICIDGGFTCPNRDGTKAFGGCIFCGERGSGERTQRISISDQLSLYFDSYRSKRANKYILYFQNFSNTYGDFDTLKAKYDEALQCENIVALDIDTRPDCITQEVCELLKSYTKKYYVYVELGLQTSNELTHKSINQHISNEDFINAVKLLRKYGIDVVVHIMVGLPNETHEDIANTIKFLKEVDYQGIKIHSTYVIKNTKLEEMYNSQKYTPLTLDDYLDELVYILTHIRDDVIVHRITGDPPKDLLVAPQWTTHKKLVINRIEKILKDKNLYQGCLYNSD